MTEQMKIVGQTTSQATSVHAFRQRKERPRFLKKETSQKNDVTKECGSCGRHHGERQKSTVQHLAESVIRVANTITSLLNAGKKHPAANAIP